MKKKKLNKSCRNKNYQMNLNYLQYIQHGQGGIPGLSALVQVGEEVEAGLHLGLGSPHFLQHFALNIVIKLAS